MMKEETRQQIQSAIKALEKAIEWIEPLRQANTGVGRIKHSMYHTKSILEDLGELAGEADRLREERDCLRHLVSRIHTVCERKILKQWKYIQIENILNEAKSSDNG